MRNRTLDLGGKQNEYNWVSRQNRHGIRGTREEPEMNQNHNIELTSNYCRLLYEFLVYGKSHTESGYLEAYQQEDRAISWFIETFSGYGQGEFLLTPSMTSFEKVFLNSWELLNSFE